MYRYCQLYRESAVAPDVGEPVGSGQSDRPRPPRTTAGRKTTACCHLTPSADVTLHAIIWCPGTPRRAAAAPLSSTPSACQLYALAQHCSPNAQRGEKATRRRRASGVRNAIGRIPARIDSADQDKAGVTASREPKEGDTAPDLGRDGRCAEMKSIRRLLSVSRSTITCVNILVRQKAIATGIWQRALAEFPCYAFLRRNG